MKHFYRTASRFAAFAVLLLGLCLSGSSVFAQPAPKAEADPFSGLAQYSIVDKDGAVIGNGYILLDRQIEKEQEFFTKTINMDFANTGQNLNYELHASLRGRLRQVNYRNTMQGAVAVEYSLNADGREVSYSIKTQGGDAVNATTTLTQDVPVLQFLNHYFVQENALRDGAEATFGQFNMKTHLVDMVKVKCMTFTGTDIYLPENITAYELTVNGGGSADYALGISRVLIDAQGTIYRIDFSAGYSFVLLDNATGAGSQADTDWYNITLGANKKIGYAKTARKPLSIDGIDHLEVVSTIWIVEGGKTYRWDERFVFQPNLQLREGSVDVWQGASKIVEARLAIKKGKLEVEGRDLLHGKKIAPYSRDWSPESIFYDALGEYFRSFSIDENLAYNFTVVVPAFRGLDQEVKIKTTQVQYTYDSTKTIDYLGEKVDVLQLSAKVGGNPVVIWVDLAGRVYKYSRFSEFDFALMGEFVKTSEADAVNFRPDNNFSYVDADNNFHFKMGFRRDPFVVPEILDQPTNLDSAEAPPIAEEERDFARLQQQVRELEDAIAAKDFNKAADLIISLESGLNRSWYWPTVRSKAEKLKTIVRTLKSQHEKIGQEIRRRQAEASMKRAGEMLKSMEVAFANKEYDLVESLYSSIESLLTNDPNIQATPELVDQVKKLMKQAGDIRNRALAIQEFSAHEHEIVINGVIVGEEPHVALINNKVIAHEGDQVLVIHDKNGVESGKVYIFKIANYGIEFEYKGEKITKGFETILR